MTAPGTSTGADWRITLKRRLTVVAGVMAFWVVSIEARLVYLQTFARPDLLARAERQQERTQVSPAKRGDILDRRGRVLATSAGLGQGSEFTFRLPVLQTFGPTIEQETNT